MNVEQRLAHRFVAAGAMNDAARLVRELPEDSAERREWEGVRDACAREVARTDYHLTGERAPVRP